MPDNICEPVKKKMPQIPPQPVLFITSTRLGDAVLSMGLIDHILKTLDNPRLTIVSGPLPSTLFEGVPNLDRHIALKKKPRHGHWVDLWKQAIGTKWHTVVDLRNSAVSRLIRAKHRCIFGPHINTDAHKVEQNAAVMKLQTPPAPRLWLSSAQTARAAGMMNPDPAQKILGVGPTANWIGKTWPVDRFKTLVKILTAPDGILPNAHVAVFAAPGEERDAIELLNSIPENRRIDLIAKTDPGTAAACLSLCDFFVGNDSGLMHCAAAAGIPTLGLFGPSYDRIYAPWGHNTAFVRTPETFDQLIDFTGYHPKTLDRSLMTTLDVETAANAAVTLWNRLKTDHGL